MRYALVLGVVLLVFVAGCDEMISEMLKGDAELDRAARSGDPNACLKLNASEDSGRMETCIGEMARYEKNEGVCELLMSGYYKDACIEKAAIAKGDAKLCLTLSGNRDPCTKEVAVRLRDRSYCDDVANADVKNACLKETALAQGNSNWCREIPDPYTRRTCLYEYAVDHTIVSVCDETETMRNPCVSAIALRKGSADDCLKLTDGLYNCVYGVAEDKKDASLCLAITSAGTRDKCVHNIAVSTHDAAVCARIDAAAVKNECLRSISLDVMQ